MLGSDRALCRWGFSLGDRLGWWQRVAVSTSSVGKLGGGVGEALGGDEGESSILFFVIVGEG